MDPNSQVLPHLIEVLHEARKASGVEWWEYEQTVRGQPFFRERSACLDLERADPQPEDKYWRNIDAFVSCYALAFGKDPYAMWQEALRRAKKARK